MLIAGIVIGVLLIIAGLIILLVQSEEPFMKELKFLAQESRQYQQTRTKQSSDHDGRKRLQKDGQQLRNLVKELSSELGNSRIFIDNLPETLQLEMGNKFKQADKDLREVVSIITSPSCTSAQIDQASILLDRLQLVDMPYLTEINTRAAFMERMPALTPTTKQSAAEQKKELR